MSTPGWLGQLATVSGCILPATLSALIGVAIVTVASYRLSYEWWWSGGTAPTGALPDARYHSTERQSSSKSVQRITEPQTSQPRGLPCGGWPASSKVILMPCTCSCTCVCVHTCVGWVNIGAHILYVQCQLTTLFMRVVTEMLVPCILYTRVHVTAPLVIAWLRTYGRASVHHWKYTYSLLPQATS